MAKQTEAQRSALRIAVISGLFRDIAIARGGTGHLRKPLSYTEYQRRKKRNKAAKMARKGNRV
jgi:hypothetical protein